MPLDGFDRLFRDADSRAEPVAVAAAGGGPFATALLLARD